MGFCLKIIIYSKIYFLINEVTVLNLNKEQIINIGGLRVKIVSCYRLSGNQNSINNLFCKINKPCLSVKNNMSNSKNLLHSINKLYKIKIKLK